MYIEKLSLLYFKNYNSLEISFSTDINLLTGLNGSGKTNLMDAIFCLCLTKSFLGATESQLVTHQAPYFSVHGYFQSEQKNQLVQYNFDGKKKTFLVEQESYTRLSDHIGRFPAVVLTPYDTDMIREGSEERRKFFDSLFSQADAPYLQQLIQYQHYLKQRNALLKSVAEGARMDYVLLEMYDAHLLQLNKQISQQRKALIDKLEPVFRQYYDLLSPEHEVPSLIYTSEVVDTSFESDYKKNVSKDLALQRTTKGIHKDDYSFLLQQNPVKQYGSQGQQKTFMIALKLAQYAFLKEILGVKPILLMDDIFDKLDDVRIEKLIRWVKEDFDGQIFISDARPERSSRLLSSGPKDIRIFNVANGAAIENKHV